MFLLLLTLFVAGENRMNNDHEILTIEEAAEYLRMGKRSIYKLAKAGEIPSRKILNKYRFVKTELREWVRSK